MRKIFAVILTCLLYSFPNIANALLFIPTAQLTVITNTIPGDGVFNYLLFQGNQEVNSWETATVGGTESYTMPFLTASPTSYRLFQGSVSGSAYTVACSSLSQASVITISNNQALINLHEGDEVTCIFNNAPVQSKNKALLIPGIMGTEMLKGSEKLWADVTRMLITNNDRFMDPLSYTRDGYPLDGSIVTGEVLSREAGYDYSEKFAVELAERGYAIDSDLFYFPYDWRKDVRDVALQDLKAKIDALVPVGSTEKLDVIAHSQGGLVIKYLLYAMPEYRSKIGKLIFVGTPHLGAPKAAKALLYGDSMGVDLLGLGLDPQEIKRIGANMPSVYNLLPSREYFNHMPGYLGTTKKVGFLPGVEEIKIYNYDETKQTLRDRGLNSTLIDRAQEFHQAGFDAFDFGGTGVDTYNIVGCQEATIGRVFARSNGKYRIEYGPGDGTVPVFSANNIGGSQVYYALDTNHGTMLTGDGTRDQILNILEGNNAVASEITTNSAQCQFEGRQVSVHSPVDLHIYDEHGNHVGPTTGGGFDYEIPHVQYDVFDDQKFAFLPSGHTYRVELPATGNGAFDLYSEKIDNGSVASTAYYHAVPINSSSKGLVELNEANNQVLQMDANGDGGTDSSILPTSVLDSQQSKDVLAPATAAAATGTQGQPGWYRSSVQVGFTATDYTQGGASPAGLLETKCQVDSGQWAVCGQTMTITTEGAHTIKFYSTDKAGNSETEQILQFTIDKTAPEVSMQWSSVAKDVAFTGVDGPGSSPTVTDAGNIVSVQDKAGNVTVLTFAQRSRRQALRAELTGITYNGTPAAVVGNKLLYYWQLNKQGQLTLLSQYTASHKNYSILGVYDGKKTTLVGLDTKGIINKKLTGLVLLKIQTNKGLLQWSY